MTVAELPDELIHMLTSDWPCRESQFRQLDVLLSPSLSNAATIIVHGPHATGKSSVIKAYLQATGLPSAFVRCQECITERHLLERTVKAVQSAIVDSTFGNAAEHNGKCENLNALVSQLQELLQPSDRFLLVFDGLDKQREAGPTLGPALVRLGEIIPNLTTIIIVQDSWPGSWRKPGVLHIHFPPYSRDQSVHILARKPPDIFDEAKSAAEGYSDRLHEEDKAWLWPRFCAAVWDSIGQSAARDLISFSDVCHKLWAPFTAPIVRGELGTRDFSRLMVLQRKLFQDENILLDHIVDEEATMQSAKKQLQLPYYAKWLLLAAFLASTNPARLDALYFMKATEKKRRKKGGARPGAKASQQNKIARHRMGPAPFPLDRLLAILHAILPDVLRSNIDVQTQITTLTSLRLLARSAGIGVSEAVDAGSKWKTGSALTWELVSAIAGSLDFPLTDFLVS